MGNIDINTFYKNKKLNLLLFLIAIVFFLFSCDVTNTGQTDKSKTTPYFTYKINNGNSVEVNCEKIRFEATSGGNYVQALFGQSESINSTFSYAFYGSAAIMDTLEKGEYPLLPYTGWSSKIPMHFSLKVPKTIGNTDYYLTIESSSGEYKHTIESIKKDDIENGKRVYFISGSYKLKAENIIDEEIVDIVGDYYFKLLTVDE